MLDEQFNDVEQFDSPSCSTSSKPTPPVKKNDRRPPEKPKFTKTPQANEVKLTDDFGDINAQLQDAILELNKLADDGTSTKKKIAPEPTVAHTQRVSAVAETGQKHGGSSSIHGVQHPQREKHLKENAAEPTAVHVQRVSAVAENGQQRGATGSIQGSQHPQREKHLVENEKSIGKKQATETLMVEFVPHQSFPSGRKSWKEDGGSREDAVSVKSTDSRSSTNSLSQSTKSVRSSSRSVVSETTPQVLCFITIFSFT